MDPDAGLGLYIWKGDMPTLSSILNVDLPFGVVMHHKAAKDNTAISLVPEGQDQSMGTRYIFKKPEAKILPPKTLANVCKFIFLLIWQTKAKEHPLLIAGLMQNNLLPLRSPGLLRSSINANPRFYRQRMPKNGGRSKQNIQDIIFFRT